MKWILQPGITDFGYLCLIEALKNRNIDYTMVKVVPDGELLISPDFDTFAREPNLDDDLFIDPSERIFPFGTIGLSKTAKNRSWIPGSFDNEEFTFEKWSNGFGLDNLLNGQSQIVKFGDIFESNDNYYFIRPCDDDKSFAGKVISNDEFKIWKDAVLKCTDHTSPLNKDTLITIAPVKEIYTECRVMIVNQKVITASYYKFGLKVRYEEVKDGEPVLAYAEEMANIYSPADAFILDIADTPLGFKIIEINNINSVGLYNMDVHKFIDAMENMKV